MSRSHDPLVIRSDIHKDLVERHVLLIMRADQVMKGVAGDCQDGLAIEFGVIETVQQMQPARSRRRETDPKFVRKLCITTGSEGSRFFMTDLDDGNGISMHTQGFINTVNAVARQTKNGIDAPIDQSFDQQVRNCLDHYLLHII